MPVIEVSNTVMQRLEILSNRTLFSPSEIASKILDRHLSEAEETSHPARHPGVSNTPLTAEPSKPEVDDSRSQEEHHPVDVSKEESHVSPPCLKSVMQPPASAAVFAGGNRTSYSHPKRVSLAEIRGFESLDLVHGIWNEHDGPISQQELFDEVIFSFCKQLGSNVNKDIEMIKDHLDLDAKRNHFRGGRLYSKKTGLSFPYLGLEGIVKTSFKVARAIDLPLSLTFRLIKSGFNLPAGSLIEVSFDPENISEKNEGEEDISIGPGSCVRVKYVDTGDIRQIYIKKDVDDQFDTMGGISIGPETPLAKSLAQHDIGSYARFSTGGNMREVMILDAW